MRVKLTIAISMVMVVGIGAIGVLPSAADHGLPHVSPLARGGFIDHVAAKLKVKQDGRGTEVINLKEASDAVVVEIVIHDGAVAPWHTHAGPGILVNAGPGTLTSVTADDCLPREVPAGAAVIDPGQGTPHAASNESGDDLVLYAVFLGVANGPVIPADPPADCDPFPA